MLSLNQARLASINVILNGDTESPSEEEEGRDEAVELRSSVVSRTTAMKVATNEGCPRGDEATRSNGGDELVVRRKSLDVMWNGCGLNLTD